MPSPVYMPFGRLAARPWATSISDASRSVRRDLPCQPEQPQRQQRRGGDEALVVGPQQHVLVHVLKRRGQVLVQDPHHLLGRDAVGDGRGDEGAGAGADVDVELVDRAVDGEQIEGAQGADLVHGAGESAAPEYERSLRPLLPTGPRTTASGGIELDDLAHCTVNVSGLPASQPGQNALISGS